MQALYWIVTALGLGTLVAGYTGAVWPPGDSLAILRVPVALAGILWVAVGWWAGLMHPLWILAVCLPLAGPLWSKFGPEQAGSLGVSLYQKNLLWIIPSLDELEADIRAAAPDVLTLQEVVDTNRPLLDRLSDMLPYRLDCPLPRTVGGTAVASRWPILEGEQICEEGLAAIRVAAPGGPLWVVSVHLHWAWPKRGWRHGRTLEEALAKLDGPAVMGGDFNQVPWSAAVRRLGRAAGTKRAGWVGRTFLLRGWIPLPIDHVFTPDGHGQVVRRDLHGSDHYGLLLRS